MPVNDIISSFYLGTTVMELLDMGNISPLFGFVNELRGSLPVASSNVYMYPDGTLSDTIDESKRRIYRSIKNGFIINCLMMK